MRSRPWFCSGNWLVSSTDPEHLVPSYDSVATVHPRLQCILVVGGLAPAQSLNCIPLAISAYCIRCLPLECIWYKGTSCNGLKFKFSTISSLIGRWGYLGGTTGNGEMPWGSISPLWKPAGLRWPIKSWWDPSICSPAWMRRFTSSVGWPTIA